MVGNITDTKLGVVVRDEVEDGMPAEEDEEDEATEEAFEVMGRTAKIEVGNWISCEDIP